MKIVPECCWWGGDQLQSDRVTPAVTAQQVGTGGGAQIQALAAEWTLLQWFPVLLGGPAQLWGGCVCGVSSLSGILGNNHG